MEDKKRAMNRSNAGLIDLDRLGMIIGTNRKKQDIDMYIKNYYTIIRYPQKYPLICSLSSKLFKKHSIDVDITIFQRSAP